MEQPETAEEKLKELYETSWHSELRHIMRVDEKGRVELAPKDIDLIANLVVERLSEIYNRATC